jgi:hypothetical protein
MRRVRVLTGVAAAVLLVAAAACEDAGPGPTPVPTPTPVTEKFSGSLTVNGAIHFPFAATGVGAVTATLSTVAPDATTVVGLSLGTVNIFGVCQVVLDNPNATQSVTVTGQVNAIGTLCARVYDSGKMTDQITFEITVVHP